MRAVIIDDDPMVCDINRRCIERDGRFDSTEIFLSGHSALEYLRGNPAELVLLDADMPRLGGFDLLTALRSEHIPADAIFITAANDFQSIDKAMALGALDYLIKPFEYPRFVRALNKFFLKREMASGGGAATQKYADLLFNHSPAAEKQEKGIQPQTLEMIRRLLEENRKKSCSGGEIAEKTGLSRVTVHKYLNYMESRGMLQTKIDYKTEGRPCLRYSLLQSV